MLDMSEHAGTRAEMLLNHLVSERRRGLEFKVVEIAPALHVGRLGALRQIHARFSAVIAEEDFFFRHFFLQCIRKERI